VDPGLLTPVQEVVDFLRAHMDDVINEVHGFGHLLVDDGKVSLNCPPAPESDDTHGGLLIRTVSEQSPDKGEHIILSREFKVRIAAASHAWLKSVVCTSVCVGRDTTRAR
jgi:hypothetical protein